MYVENWNSDMPFELDLSSILPSYYRLWLFSAKRK